MLMNLKRWIDTKIVARSGEFDSHYYLLQNDDVRRADLDPLSHYMRFGWKEGRDPSSRFSTNFYLQNNPDVLQAGTNPLLHYARFGKKEGRQPKNRAPTSVISPITRAQFVPKHCSAYTFACPAPAQCARKPGFSNSLPKIFSPLTRCACKTLGLEVMFR